LRIKKLRTLFLIVILLAIGTVVAVFVGYRKVSNAPELLLSSIKEGANLSLGKIRQTATRDGRKEWSLEAGSADYMENDKKAVLKDLFITYFLEDNREVYLNADQGILNTETNDIEFSGHVVIRNENYRLTTEKLSYEHYPGTCQPPERKTEMVAGKVADRQEIHPAEKPCGHLQPPYNMHFRELSKHGRMLGRRHGYLYDPREYLHALLWVLWG